MAGRQHGLLCGTREVVIAEMSCKAIEGLRMRPDSGDGLGCSSIEGSEREWSERLGLFSFVVIDNQSKLG
jgi:hypothetical protein